MNYRISVQIQKLNQLFNQGTSGNIYVVLLQRIPNDHEIVLSASNTYGDGSAKDIGLSLSVTNPVAVIRWPLPQIDKAATFRIHAQLRPSQALPQPVNQGMQNLLSELGHSGYNEEQKTSDHDMAFRLGSGQRVAMMIFNGKRKHNSNGDRLCWVNVQLSNIMTFSDMVDCACAQLGLDPPGQNSNGFGFGGVTQYVVRNQMGHRCDDKEVVVKYLQRTVKEQNSNMFPVFVFSATSQSAQAVNNQLLKAQAPQQKNPFNFGGW